MQENASDAYAFLAMVCLPFVVWIVTRPPVWIRLRPRLEPVGVRLWQQLVEPDQPDERVLLQWAALRLEQLQAHLERVRRLILDDEWMTATRQTANRMAHEHLVRDVREAKEALAAFGEIDPFASSTPTPLSTTRFAYSTSAARPVAEVIEFGPSGRWL